MSNAEAAISIATVYEDVDANPDFATDFPGLPQPSAQVRPHPMTVRAPYTIVTTGEAVVADGTAEHDVISVDVGDIATEVTGFLLQNLTAQELTVKINGAATFGLMPGAMLAHSSPVGGAATPITALAFVATAVEQVGDQVVAFQLFGDPES